MKVVVAGASGFIGSEFVRSLLGTSGVDEFSIIALSRGEARASDDPRIEWRKVDLLDSEETRAGVKGADIAVYLVHAMLPQARLVQGDFADFDLLQADNFARACAREKVARIIYLGGILPEAEGGRELSPHLRSRLEVESALAGYENRVTILRAGLIFGKGGSSCEILFRLVRRLPIMLLPSWTATPTEPVHVLDVVAALERVIRDVSFSGKVWDLGSGERIAYRELIAMTATILGLRRTFIGIPYVSPKISRWWVSLITRAPAELVTPLVASLTHAMVSREDHRFFRVAGIRPRTVETAIREAITVDVNPHAYRPAERRSKWRGVRSIQRIVPARVRQRELRSEYIAELYFWWIPKFLFGLMRIEKEKTAEELTLTFRVPVLGARLLVLKKTVAMGDDTERPHRLSLRAYRVTGGLLVTPETQGFLEFRSVRSVGVILASLQGFVPRLPWPIYRYTQAKVHLWVMRSFGRIFRARREKTNAIS